MLKLAGLLSRIMHHLVTAGLQKISASDGYLHFYRLFYDDPLFTQELNVNHRLVSDVLR